jgi:superfamily I DNA/RNA helicase
LIRSQLNKLHPLACCSSIEEGKDYDKVYVDEIQDFTQAEITLFFLAAGLDMQSLFLAGDPAQAVVEGKDFRFEDLRAIPHKLSGGKVRLNRPFRLVINYRSHSGILLCAAAVLAKLFAVFPGSAKELPPDMGAFQGPRPAYFQADGYKELASLLADSEIDENEKSLSAMGSLNLLLGIREAKGLEFADVALLDFFSSLSDHGQRAWKQLLSDDSLTDMPYLFPQVETQLKLLYTAMTRSCNRLIFIGTTRSDAGDVFFRWLREKHIAEELIIGEGKEIITGDELTAQGIQCALSAEAPNTILLIPAP